MARNLSLRAMRETLLLLWAFTFVLTSTEAVLVDSQECISGENYCHRPDICAYVFTFNASEGGTCPDLDQAVIKVDQVVADVELLGLKLQSAKIVGEMVEQRQDSMRDLISQQNEIITALEGNIRRNSDGNDRVLDVVTSKMRDVQQQLSDRDARITELEAAVSRLSAFYGPPALALVTTTTKIVVNKAVPDLTAITACIWVKITETGHDASLVSYAVPGSDNEFLIHYYGVGFHLFVGNVLKAVDIAPIDDRAWHHVCITWSSGDGTWKYYHNGVFSTGDTGLNDGGSISGGGSLILGQEQDEVGGRFDTAQALVGGLAEFNIWSRVLSDEEIADVADGGRIVGGGDVFTWNIDDLTIEGDVTLTIMSTKN